MFCSSCGAALGAVGHIFNDQLLCEDCYNKLEASQRSLPNTLLIGESSEENLKAASDTIAAESQEKSVVPSHNDVMTGKLELKTGQEGLLFSKFLVPGESVLWKRSFSKGIINRHLTYTEIVTNLRAVCIDDEKLAIVRYAQISSCEISVGRERRQYSGMHTGYETGRVYAGTSSGTSTMFGDVSLIQDGKIAITFYNVRDPHGLKELILASKKSSRDARKLV